MISPHMLGRYEFHSQSTDSHKFYHVYFDHMTGTYTCEHGRCGRTSMKIMRGIPEEKALKKIVEKINKGYEKVTDRGYTIEVNRGSSPPTHKVRKLTVQEKG